MSVSIETTKAYLECIRITREVDMKDIPGDTSALAFRLARLEIAEAIMNALDKLSEENE